MTFYLTLLSLWLPLSFATEEFTSGNHLFTSSVYKQIRKNESGNFLVSPISAEIILALTQSGARGKTAEEIISALYLPKSQEKIESAFQNIQPLLRKDELYTLHTANKIYLRKDFQIKDAFNKTAIEIFDSEIERINFEENEAAAKSINEWVENRTEHKIKNLIKSSSLSNETTAILINALYFKGNWSYPFVDFLTHEENFYRNETDMVQVETMHNTMETNYCENKELNAKFLEIPFEGGDVTFTIVLPNEVKGLDALEAQIEKIFVKPNYTNQNLEISLPKFKIESEVDFKKILRNLGVKDIFNEDAVDLSGIAGVKGDFVVDDVLQKTFIDVNEKGVEAAGATFVAVIDVRGPDGPEEIKIDHPFIFYLKVKELVIFAGRVVDPSV